MKQLLLLALVIVCGIAAIKFYTGRSTPESLGYRTITAEEAKERLDAGAPLVLLDVRTQEEFDEAHIPGAVCLPNEAIGGRAPAELPDKDAEILIYCRSGRRSAEAAGKLAKLGYTNVADFGGIIDWPYETTSD